MVLAIYLSYYNVNKITECLKMTTFNVFFSAETTCTADVLHSYLVFSIYLAIKKETKYNKC